MIVPARVQITGCFFQILLAGTLTLGWFGVSSFGILGTAIAMVISHFCMVLYLFIYIKFKQKNIKLIPYNLNKKSLFDIMNVGAGGLINSVTIAVTVAVVTASLSHHCIEALAGYSL